MKWDTKFTVGLIVRKGKVLITTIAVTEQGAFIDVDPVYTVSLSSEEIAKTVAKMREAGNPTIPHPEDFRKIPQVMLKASKTKSWNQLVKDAAAYTIIWRTNDIILYATKPRTKFETDVNRTRYFSPDTGIEEVVQAILDDIESRPELKQ